jgi:hypothetical protein
MKEKFPAPFQMEKTGKKAAFTVRFMDRLN